MATAKQIIDQALRRLDELLPATPTRWTRPELLVFLNDALHELNLIAAAFQDTVPVAVTSANNVYDAPVGTIAPLAVSVGGRYLVRQSVDSLDNEGDWELPEAVRMLIRSWAPLGLNKIVIAPRPLAATTASLERLVAHTAVTDAEVALPVLAEYEKAVENFVVNRGLLKEGGAEFRMSLPLYKDFLDDVQELSGRQVLRSAPLLETMETAVSSTTLREAGPRPEPAQGRE